MYKVVLEGMLAPFHMAMDQKAKSTCWYQSGGKWIKTHCLTKGESQQKKAHHQYPTMNQFME
jgi:hypothetical protein